MTTWTDIPDSVFQLGKPGRATDMRALRDNVPAVAGAAPGAPLLKAGWCPCNMVAIGDGADGLIYDRSVDPAVSVVEMPAFEATMEYLLELEGLSSSESATINIEMFLGTSRSWGSALAFPTIAGAAYHGSVLFMTPGQPATVHGAMSCGITDNVGAQVIAFGAFGEVRNATRQTVTTARIRSMTGKFDAGVIRLYKRGGFLGV